MSTTDTFCYAWRKNFYGTISVDDSGLEDTGKLQWYTSIGIDPPFHKNDMLRIGMNLDGAQDGYEKGTRGHNISYTTPIISFHIYPSLTPESL